MSDSRRDDLEELREMHERVHRERHPTIEQANPLVPAKGLEPQPPVPRESLESRVPRTRNSLNGIVMNFQAGRINRLAALDAVRALRKGDLEVLSMELKTAINAREKQLFVLEKTFFEQLRNFYSEAMDQLGLANIARRRELMAKAHEQYWADVQKTRATAREQGWAQSMIDRYLSLAQRDLEEFEEKAFGSWEVGESPPAE